MPNALQHETSPYLLQHADNPVDWRPWGPAALQLAQEQQKPILLSIGYSACHWCHVMAHESFEDAETAALMNDLYVNIKVDREERPDLDRIYQLSQQLMSGRPGGWPLTVFLTPAEQWPIFAGTYFPKRAAYGMPSFTDVLQRVHAYYRSHRSEVDALAERLLDALERSAQPSDDGLAIDSRFHDSARRRLGEAFDAANGGFGAAPKFPHPTEVGFLLDRASTDESAGEMARATLSAMASGGLFDHLAGGFFRYCVDAEWRIPHFEKMLYDNAALLGLYSEAAAMTHDPVFTSTANATADWLLSDMRDADGAFFATLDADSEGEEGLYYIFDRDDLERALTPSEREAASVYFGVDQPANFEQKSWHLQPRERVLPFGAAGAEIESARRKLLQLRNQRVRPGRDEKILVGWNGLAVANLARAARYLEREELGVAAQQAVDFVHAHLWHDGRLNAVFKDGRARFAGYLDDYAFLALGLTELLQWQFRARDLTFAIELTEAMISHFADPAGGFFFTADDHEQLIHRPKSLADEALPSGNGTAAIVLDTLGHLLGETRYLEFAAKTVNAASRAVAMQPEAHASLLEAMGRRLEAPEIVVIRGDRASLSQWQTRLDRGAHPNRLLFLIADDIGDLPGLLQSRAGLGATTAYVCQGVECLEPLTDLETVAARLGVEPQ